MKAGRGGSINELPDQSDVFSNIVIQEAMATSGHSDPKPSEMCWKQIFDMFSEGRFNVFPDYQRGNVADIQWGSELARVCMLTCAPVSPLMIYDTGTEYEVMDGSQRASAMIAFMSGMYPVKDNSGDTKWFCVPGSKQHWSTLTGESSPGGIDAFVSRAPIHRRVSEFYSNCRALMHDAAPADCGQLSHDMTGAIYSRRQLIIMMPSTWTRQLCMMYIVYSGLKTWRQTKYENLMHLNDGASSILKGMAAPFSRSLSAAGSPLKEIDSKLAYYAVVKAFACLSGFPSVPVETDEVGHISLMMEISLRYSRASPDAEVVSLLSHGTRWFEDNAAALAKHVKRFKMSVDAISAVLYSASTNPGLTIKSAFDIIKIMKAKPNKKSEYIRQFDVSVVRDIEAADRSKSFLDACKAVSRVAHR